MASFGPEVTEKVKSVCQTNAVEAGGALSRTFDQAITLELGTETKIDEGVLSGSFEEPGLMVILKVADAGVLMTIPESSGALPAWYRNPDSSGRSKLGTLAQELGMLLLPDDLMPDDFQAYAVVSLAKAITAGNLPPEAMIYNLTLKCQDKTSALSILWPVPGLAEVKTFAEQNPPPAVESAPTEAAPSAAATPTAEPAAAPAPAPLPAAASEPPPAPPPRGQRRALNLQDLPSYSRSLLRIKVPVNVTLASKRQPVNKILSLTSGTLIQFEKPCEEMLDLCVGNQKVAEGEVVKVGEKFGLRITSFIFPDERFKTVPAPPPRPQPLVDFPVT